MTNPTYGTPYVDPTANLSQQQKEAASKAGYGISVLTEDAKYQTAEAQRKSSAGLPVPEVK